MPTITSNDTNGPAAPTAAASQTITIERGTYIERAAKILAAAAPARAIFNGTEIRATGVESADDIVAAYYAAQDAAAEATRTAA